MSDRRQDGRVRPMLVADDWGLTQGVTSGIEELARERRLSATSAIVTLPRWHEDGPRLRALRDRLAVGLHINLTLGEPLGPMPLLAPNGRLPSLTALARASLRGDLDRPVLRFEIKDEVRRQIDRFMDRVGYPPDHIDGHQHVHAFWAIRHAVLAAIARAPHAGRPLVRDPSESPWRLAARGRSPRLLAKAGILNMMTAGFATAVQAARLPTNEGFSGLSMFDRAVPYALELERAMQNLGPAPMIMCHPGHPDAELAALDRVAERRRDELAALKAFPMLQSLIWSPTRVDAGAPIDWASFVPPDNWSMA